MIEKPDGAPTPEQEAVAQRLTKIELAQIDSVLLSHALDKWRKIANIIGRTMNEVEGKENSGAEDSFSEVVKGLCDVFYSQRVRDLVNSGLLESRGNLDYMRYSEVRLPQASNAEGKP